MKIIIRCLFFCAFFITVGQDSIVTISEINIGNLPSNQIKKYWLKLMDNAMSQPVLIPVIVAKGDSNGPVLALTAAIHGNELNGIPIIHELIEELDIDQLKGTVLAIPGLNSISIPLHQRRFLDDEDINRSFPGKEHGNRSQQFAWQINQKVLAKIDFLVDMHTASFGRINSLYVRADLTNEQIKTMAFLQDADMILNSLGPTAAAPQGASRTMRAEAMLKNIPTITVEYGNPQVFQNNMTDRGKKGIKNIMAWLGMVASEVVPVPKAELLSSSFWIYTDQGGYLEVHPEINQKVGSGELIATLKNPFGDVIKYYNAPQAGIVIGKSTNPVNIAGGRILHLGILQE